MNRAAPCAELQNRQLGGDLCGPLGITLDPEAQEVSECLGSPERGAADSDAR